MTDRRQSQHNQKMKKRHQRSVLFWIFITISIPIAILTLFIASGYRFDTNTRTIVQASSMMIESTPRNISLTIDNTDTIEIRTPYIQKIDSGVHTIKIQKEGYHTWGKKLSFEESKSIIFPQIVLFPTQPPKKSTLSSITKKENGTIQPLPKDLEVSYIAEGFKNVKKLKVLVGPMDLLVDTEKNAAYLIDSLNSFNDEIKINGTITASEWSSGRSLAYAMGGEIWKYDIDGNKQELLKRQSTPIIDLAWHENDGYLFYSDKTGLYVMELDERDWRQTWKIADITDATELTLSKKGDALLFISQGAIYSYALE